MTLYGVLRWSVSPVVRAFGRLEVDGAGGVPAGPVVVVANHDSRADPFFLGAALDRPLRYACFVGKCRLRQVLGQSRGR